MEVVQEALSVSTQLMALNLPGGEEIFKVYRDSGEAPLVQNEVRRCLSKTYYLFPDVFPTKSTLTSPDSDEAYLEVPDRGSYGRIAKKILSLTEDLREVTNPENNPLVFLEFDSERNAHIPLDCPQEAPLGSEILFGIDPYMELAVTDAEGIEFDHHPDFQPLRVYSLPVRFIGEVEVESLYPPHIPLVLLGYYR